jgi:hypothetical protein
MCRQFADLRSLPLRHPFPSTLYLPYTASAFKVTRADQVGLDRAQWISRAWESDHAIVTDALLAALQSPYISDYRTGCGSL